MATYSKWTTVDVEVDFDLEDMADALEDNGYLVLDPDDARVYDVLVGVEIDRVSLREMADRLREMEDQSGKYDRTLRDMLELIDLLVSIK